MQSPFFWRNLAVLLVVLANLVLCGRLLQLHGLAAGPGTGSVATGVILRGSTLLYATLSVIVALVAILLFCLLEVFSDSRQTWERSARWGEITAGMSQQDVLDRLGEPFQRLPSQSSAGGAEEQFVYQLHPLGAHDAGAVGFRRVVAGPMLLTDKFPDDAAWARGRAEWIPSGYTRVRYRETIVQAASVISLGGLLLLGLGSVLPLGVRAGMSSWTLYIPLLALLLGLIYEAGAPRGWRFDLLLVYPVFAVILIGWAVRLVPLLRAHS